MEEIEHRIWILEEERGAVIGTLSSGSFGGLRLILPQHRRNGPQALQYFASAKRS
jgi:hypothetical protein